MSEANLRDLKTRYRLTSTGGKLLIRHVRQEDLCLTLSALRGEPQYPAQSPGTQPEPLIMLDRGQDDVASKLNSFVDDIARHFEVCGPSSVLRLTLRQAAIMAPEIKVCNPNTPPRRAYFATRAAQGTLLPRAMNIWVLVQTLTEPSLPFVLYHLSPSSKLDHHPRTATKLPFADTSPQADGHAAPIALVVSSILAELEGLATSLWRDVLDDLERALMRTIDWRRFEVFPAAVLLLTCMERMEWFARCVGGDAVSMQV